MKINWISLTSVVTLAVLGGATSCAGRAPTQPSTHVSVAMQPATSKVVLDGYSLTFVNVESDSRCPSDVVCVTAGNAVVAVTFGVASLPTIPAKQSLNTTTEPRAVIVSGYQIRLDSLKPYPISTRAIAPGEYTAYLSVTKLGPD